MDNIPNRDGTKASALDLRAAPTQDFITGLRQKYVLEHEIDHILSRKLAIRSGAGYTAISLETLIEGTRALIKSEIGDDFVLSNPRWLQGGASKLQMAFDLEWNGLDGRARQRTAMVLRMEPPESIVQTSRRREFEVLKLMHGTVPVPAVYWVDADGNHLPHPGLVYGYIPGDTKPSTKPCQVAKGLGTAFRPELREPIAEQFIAHLAAAHTVDAGRLATLEHFDPAKVGSNESIVRQINWWRRVWDEDRPEDIPLFDVAAQWLIANAQPLDHVSVVHGDYRIGNILFTEADKRITACLDWELAVLGDRHQDIAWATGPSRNRYAEDGKTALACGLLPAEELYARYEKASGLVVDPKRLRYFQVFNGFMATAHMLATAWRVAYQGKTHQDVVVASHSIIGDVIVGKLRDLLEKVL